MSYIFDALQRSEAERSGVELDAQDLPTELLQMVESAVQAHRTVDRQAEERIPDSRMPETERPEVTDEVNYPPESFPQLESLPVALPHNTKLVSATEKESLAAEKFRFLAVRLRQLRQKRHLKSVLITSTMPEEGKSMVAANLACTLASRREQKILLLEGDLRRPTLRQQFGLGRITGLTDYLQGTTTAAQAIYRLDALGIWIMAAGTAPHNPLELLQAGKLAPLMEQLEGWFDWIVIDSPPVLPLADTSVWTRMADGILLVTRQGTTDKEQLKRGVEALDSSKLLGALLNSSTNAAHNDYYQRYGTSSV
jgi:capsular exopolysaccharide synthesis family protein